MPDATAFLGMSAKRAVAPLCAKVIPPSALISFTPLVPSDPVPDRITPIALLLLASASEDRKWSIGRWIFVPSGGSSSLIAPSLMER